MIQKRHCCRDASDGTIYNRQRIDDLAPSHGGTADPLSTFRRPVSHRSPPCGPAARRFADPYLPLAGPATRRFADPFPSVADPPIRRFADPFLPASGFIGCALLPIAV